MKSSSIFNIFIIEGINLKCIIVSFLRNGIQSQIDLVEYIYIYMLTTSSEKDFLSEEVRKDDRAFIR